MRALRPFISLGLLVSLLGVPTPATAQVGCFREKLQWLGMQGPPPAGRHTVTGVAAAILVAEVNQQFDDECKEQGVSNYITARMHDIEADALSAGVRWFDPVGSPPVKWYVGEVIDAPGPAVIEYLGDVEHGSPRVKVVESWGDHDDWQVFVKPSGTHSWSLEWTLDDYWGENFAPSASAVATVHSFSSNGSENPATSHGDIFNLEARALDTLTWSSWGGALCEMDELERWEPEGNLATNVVTDLGSGTCADTDLPPPPLG